MLLIKELKDKGGEKLIKNCDQVLSYLNKWNKYKFSLKKFNYN